MQNAEGRASDPRALDAREADAREPSSDSAIRPSHLRDPERLAAVARTGLSGATRDPTFEQLARLTARVLAVPVAAVSLTDDRYEYLLGCVGIPEPYASLRAIPLPEGPCRHVVEAGSPVVVADLADVRLPTGEPFAAALAIGSYLGVPLVDAQGRTIGACAVADRVPRRWRPDEIELLQEVAAAVTNAIERRAAERELQVRAAHSRAVFESSGLGIGTIGVDGRWLDANFRLRAMLGYTLEELRERTVYDVTPEGEPILIEFVAPDWAGAGGVAYGEKRYRRKDGGTFTASVTAAAVHAEGDGPDYYVLVVQDVSDRVRAEAEQARQRRLLEATQRIAAIGSWEWDPATDEITWTDEMRRLLGLPPETVPSFAVLRARVHPDDLDRVRTTFVAAQESGRSFALDHRVVRADDGAVRHWRTWGELTVDEGRVVRFTGTSQDVTDAVHAEAALRESAVRLADAQRIAKVGSWDWEMSREHPEWSEWMYRLTGFDPQGPAPTVAEFFARIHAEDRDRVAETHASRLAAQTPRWATTYRFVLPSGDERWFAAESEAEYAPDGRPVRMRGTCHDITETARAAAAADLERRRLQAVLDAIPVGVSITDVDGRMTHVNAAMERIWGGPLPPVERTEDLAHLRAWWSDTGRPVEPEEWATARVLRDELPVEADGLEIERFDGTRSAILHAAAPIRDAEGRMTGAVAVVVDLSERRALEAQLRQAQKLEAVGLLAGGVAHDFNNLLTVMLSHLDLLREELPASAPELAGDLEEVHQAARRAAGLTRQLLAFSRRQVLRPEVLDVNLVLRESERLLSRALGEHHTLELALAPEPCRARADRGQLEQVVMNLVLNAGDAMPDGGMVTIETADVRLDAETAARVGLAGPGGYVRLSVSDTGVGMDEATRARAFEPFFTTKPVGEGTGLGLATAYGIVSQSGGAFDVASTPGVGSTFSLYLPRVEAPVAAGGASAAPRGPIGRGELILLAEDEVAVRRTSRRALERAGFRVVEAQHGADALLVWREHADEIALVVTDVRMPEMSGVELAQRLRAERPTLPILFVSGYAPGFAETQAAAGAPIPFLEKPYALAELLHAVRGAMGSEQ